MAQSFFKASKIRLVEFNVENLFFYLDLAAPELNLEESISSEALTEKEWQKLTSSTVGNKPLHHTRAIAKTILEMDADILMLCEVGGIESLSNFSKLFLTDRYEAHLVEGNSDRGIDLGYLVRRSLPFRYELRSHKHRTLDFLYPHEVQSKETGYGNFGSARRTSHRFSRDVLELRVFDQSEGASPDVPVMIILLVHLKSQLDRSRIDPGGRDRRKAELEKLVQIYDELDQEFKGQVPILLSGDFNGSAAKPRPEVEFEALYSRTSLEDALEVAKVPNDERFTYMQLSNRNRVGRNKQLDYIFVSPLLFSRVSQTESWVFRFRDQDGRTKLLPRSFNEKKTLPSDHYPVILTLEPETPEARPEPPHEAR